ncbi:MAG: Transcriptional regulator, DeoR family [Planctomycetaceae bacterium]|nr:Transcriptional regulator, DeoR family [Planctomycetaceae bacterium]
MKDQPALERQWRLLHALEARRLGVSLYELAAEAGVSQRTIFRDLQLMRQIGMPVQSGTGANGRKHWKINPDHPLLRLGFNPTEAASLCLGFRLMEPFAGTYLWDGAQTALKKIRSCLSEDALRYIGTFGQAFYPTRFGSGDYSKKGEILDALMLGIEERRYTALTYQSQQATEPATRDVYPYALAFHKGSLYLIAWAAEHETFRNYKVDRVTDAEVLELRFTRDPKFDVQRHLTGSFGIYHGAGEPQLVRIRFTSEAARYVKEKYWHDSQLLHDQQDGNLIAEFHLTDFHELISWILSFRDQAEVLEPASLRQQIAETIQSMNQVYATQPPAVNANKTPSNRTPK